MNFGKLFDSIKGPALALASNLIPGGPLILGAINAMLPDDKKLPETATGGEMRNAVNRLTPDQRSSLMEKQLDVEIAEIKSWEGVQGSLATADATGSSTRPFIALMMAWFVVVVGSIIAGALAIAIYSESVTTLQQIKDSWQLILTMLGTPTVLLRAYFGMRTKEKTVRYNAASGQPVSGIASMIKAFKT